MSGGLLFFQTNSNRSRMARKDKETKEKIVSNSASISYKGS